MAGRPHYRAAVVQRGTDCVTSADYRSEMEANRAAMIDWVRFLEERLAEPPRLIVFPVLTFLGASRRPSAYEQGATSLLLDDPFFDPLVEVCARFDCYLATSCVERHPAFPGRSFHTGFVLGPEGLVVRQPKVQARSSAAITVLKTFREEYIAALGEQALHAVADTPIGKIGVIVESEQFYPEVLRGLARNGAEVIVHPNLEPSRTIPYAALKQARAFENGLYLVSATPAFERWQQDGERKAWVGHGGSAVVAPSGELLVRCDAGETFACATIDLAGLDSLRTDPRTETMPDWSVYAPIYRD
ncbi:MAG: nitrilase-related carbon-nitrogen hydrolase [Dehalococcoidia bacterium]